jgi:hypothetical protein
VGWAAVAALVLAGCSSGGSGGGGGASGGRFGGPSVGGGLPTSISAALAGVPSAGWDGTYLEFGDVTQVVALNGGSLGAGPVEAYVGLGESSIAGFEEEAGSVLGFDPLKATAAVTVGQPPSQATVLYGTYDAASIGRKLTASGFKQKGAAAGGTLWAYGPDNQVNVNNPTGDAQMNDLNVATSRIAYGGSSVNVDRLVAPTGPTLASNAQLSALASCLGDASAAVITTFAPSPGSTLYGIGLVGSSGKDASEEICVSAKDSATASAIGANWTKQLETGRSQRLDQPWSKLLIDPQASVVSSSPAVVRLTSKPAAGSHVGVLLESFYAPETDFTVLTSP